MTVAPSDIQPHIPILYGRMMLDQAFLTTFWNRFEGPEGSSNPVVAKEDLVKEHGDRIRIHTSKDLVGEGVEGNSTLLGNEEDLEFDHQDVLIDQWRHGTAQYRNTREQTILNLASLSKTKLARWAAKKLDIKAFTAFTASPTYEIQAGDATSFDDMDASDTFDTSLISRAKVMADDLLIEPAFVIDGDPFYGLVIHPYQAFSLKQDDVWIAANREAMPPGKKNPLFTGALGFWDGCVLFSHGRVPKEANANSPAVNSAKGILFGATSMCHAYGRHPTWDLEFIDYNNKIGTAISVVDGWEKVTLDGNDTGVILVESACVNPNA